MEGCQIGFSRVLTDYAVYAILLDVIIQERYRGRGLGKWMMKCVTEHPDIASLKLALWTSNAEKLYRNLGFYVPQNIHFMLKTAKDARDRT